MTFEEERDQLDEKLKVNRYQLETQWEEQTELFRTWARRLVLASIEAESKKRQLDRLYCRLDMKYRGLRSNEKFTEAVIKADISLDREYLKVQDDLDVIQAEISLLKTDVESIRERKAALENEVKLYGMEYFSKPFTSEKEQDHFRTASVKDAIRKKISSIPDTSIKRTK